MKSLGAFYRPTWTHLRNLQLTATGIELWLAERAAEAKPRMNFRKKADKPEVKEAAMTEVKGKGTASSSDAKKIPTEDPAAARARLQEFRKNPLGDMRSRRSFTMP